MRAVILTLIVTLLSVAARGQSPVGKWITIDDETGEQKSIVEIYEANGEVMGKIIKLFRKPGEDQDPVCDECEEDDPRHKKKVIGMNIITGMKADGKEYSGGSILDPGNGKVYRCKLWVEGMKLQVRGFWGPFYRTQTWKKAP